jgi:thiosulfate/3-mercaptopyruvate sulfurtransferase
MKCKFCAVFLAISLVFAIAATAAQAGAEPLVSTDWVAKNLDKIKNSKQTDVRLVEVSKKGYDKGHIPGAVHIKWGDDVFAPETDHMVLSLAEIERVVRKLGITPDTHIVIYDGDGASHHLARFYWTLKYWHLNNVSIMDGGKALWEKEKRPLTSAVPKVKPRPLEVKFPPNTKIRAMYSPDITHALATGKKVIIDARNEDFYRGEVYSLNKWVRSGHITGAVNVPTKQAMNTDKTYKSREELKKIYEGKGITPDKNVITYCDTGVLATHAWFVMSEILGYKNVAVYDGSMREYANRFDTPMEPGIIGGQFPTTPIQELEQKITQ